MKEMLINGENLLGPIELPNPLNGEDYLIFLQDDLPYLLEYINLNIRQNLWFLNLFFI